MFSLARIVSAAVSRMTGEVYTAGLTAKEREAVRHALRLHNLKMVRFLVPAAVLTALVLSMVDVQRYHQGLLLHSALYQGLALAHGVFVLATLMGLRYYLPRWQVIGPNGIRGFVLFLVLFLGSICAMGVLGIVDRGSTTLMSVALMLFNLVFRLPWRVVLLLNLIVFPVTSWFRLTYGADLLSVLVGVGELLGLSVVMLLAGYGLSKQTVGNVLGEFRETQSRLILQDELEIAARLQRSLLPRRWPDVRAFRLFGIMNAAKNVGGDFYDHFTLTDGRQALVIADVCDKGVSAGLFGIMCKTISRSNMLRFASIEEVFASINQELCLDNEESMFATCIGASYETTTGLVRLVNAGHIAPLLIQANGDLQWVRAPRCSPLGLRPGRQFNAIEFRLSPGDTLFLMTDGVTEAMNPSGEAFGMDRVERVLRGLRVDDPQSCIKQLTDAVARFADQAEQSDDIACLALLHRGELHEA
jgi:hypothetical protein